MTLNEDDFDTAYGTYFEMRFEHYRTRGEDWSTSYEWAKNDAEARFRTT